MIKIILTALMIAQSINTSLAEDLNAVKLINGLKSFVDIDSKEYNDKQSWRYVKEIKSSDLIKKGYIVTATSQMPGLNNKDGQPDTMKLVTYYTKSKGQYTARCFENISFEAFNTLDEKCYIPNN